LIEEADSPTVDEVPSAPAAGLADECRSRWRPIWSGRTVLVVDASVLAPALADDASDGDTAMTAWLVCGNTMWTAWPRQAPMKKRGMMKPPFQPPTSVTLDRRSSATAATSSVPTATSAVVT
jgi:hypothetical protein